MIQQHYEELIKQEEKRKQKQRDRTRKHRSKNEHIQTKKR